VIILRLFLWDEFEVLYPCSFPLSFVSFFRISPTYGNSTHRRVVSLECVFFAEEERFFFLSFPLFFSFTHFWEQGSHHFYLLFRRFFFCQVLEIGKMEIYGRLWRFSRENDIERKGDSQAFKDTHTPLNHIYQYFLLSLTPPLILEHLYLLCYPSTVFPFLTCILYYTTSFCIVHNIHFCFYRVICFSKYHFHCVVLVHISFRVRASKTPAYKRSEEKERDMVFRPSDL
jgi:hypothetical protein